MRNQFEKKTTSYPSSGTGNYLCCPTIDEAQAS